MDRAEFREAVFQRDNYRCVFCGEPAVDAHHLIERRLWLDGGYHLDNGISVCAECHLSCEMTLFSVEEGREAAGITKIVIPEHMYDDVIYDKWGNVVISSIERAPGELFDDPSVQKILLEGGVLSLFRQYVKYPRTYHLPWSHPNKDDRTILDFKGFRDREVIVTEKMDGENTTLYNDHMHARSIDGTHHSSQGWVKQFWSRFAHDIPYGMRICGENLYAVHSVGYTKLPTYFMGFSMWNWTTCLSWDETLEYFEYLGIEPVPVLYRGPWNEDLVRRISINEETSEGYVVRIADSFPLREFRNVVAKYVREGHLQTSDHWKRHVVIRNMLSS